MKTNQQKLHLSVYLVCALFCCLTKVTAQPVIGQQISVGASLQDNFTCMALTKDSGFIAGGSSNSPVSGDKTQPNRGYSTSYDYWIVKFNKFGKKQWDKTIGGNNNDDLASILQTADGGYLLAGSSLSKISGEKSENPRGGTQQDIWLVKLNGKGQVQWDKTIGGDLADFPRSIKQTSDGGYIIGGYSNSNVFGEKTEPSRGSTDFWVIKLNADGTVAWDKTLGGKNDDKCNDVIETADGGFLVGGLSNSGISGDKTAKPKGYYDMWVVKLDKNGAKLWDKGYGGSTFDGISKLLQTPDGGFILAGYSDSNISGDKSENSEGGEDFWFVKTNAAGNVQYDKTVGGNADDGAQSIQQTWDGGYIVAGSSKSGISGDKTEENRGDVDFWIVKFNKLGNLIWDKTIGGNGGDDFVTIKERRPNQFFIGGYSGGPISGDKTVPSMESDYWLVELKYYPNGTAPGVTDDAIASKLNDNITEAFTVYPNPAKKVMYIQSSKQQSFTLTDQSGHIIFTKQVSGTVSIDIASLLPGAYYLNNKSSGIVKKIIITK